MHRIQAYGLYPVDNSRIDSSLTSAEVLVMDDDGPALSLAIDNRFVREGLSTAATGSVRRTEA